MNPEDVNLEGELFAQAAWAKWWGTADEELTERLDHEQPGVREALETVFKVGWRAGIQEALDEIARGRQGDPQ